MSTCPKKVVDIKGTKEVKTWKGGLDKKRCTLVLSVTSEGKMLEPGLILPRKTRYALQTRNNIGMKIYGIASCNAWIDSELMILWFKEILLPFIGRNKALIILDTCPAHYSTEVKKFLAKHPNIFIAPIPGGLTPILQPLDKTVNAALKNHIRQFSQAHQVQCAQISVTKNPPSQNKEASPVTSIVVKNKVIAAVSDLERIVEFFSFFCDIFL